VDEGVGLDVLFVPVQRLVQPVFEDNREQPQVLLVASQVDYLVEPFDGRRFEVVGFLGQKDVEVDQAHVLLEVSLHDEVDCVQSQFFVVFCVVVKIYLNELYFPRSISIFSKLQSEALSLLFGDIWVEVEKFSEYFINKILNLFIVTLNEDLIKFFS
jgi:hypothetical protein